MQPMEPDQGKMEKWETGEENSQAPRRASNRLLSAVLKTTPAGEYFFARAKKYSPATRTPAVEERCGLKNCLETVARPSLRLCSRLRLWLRRTGRAGLAVSNHGRDARATKSHNLLGQSPSTVLLDLTGRRRRALDCGGTTPLFKKARLAPPAPKLAEALGSRRTAAPKMPSRPKSN